MHSGKLNQPNTGQNLAARGLGQLAAMLFAKNFRRVDIVPPAQKALGVDGIKRALLSQPYYFKSLPPEALSIHPCRP